MRRIAIILALILCLASQALAFTCSGCTPIFAETWGPQYGTGGVSGYINSQEYANDTGISIVSTVNPPWNPTTNAGWTGYYAHMVPASCSSPSACTGIYIQLGNTHQRIGFMVWFKAESGFVGANSFFFRYNQLNNYYGNPPVEVDFIAPNFTSAGLINTAGGTTSSGITDTNWHTLISCVDMGTGGSTGTSYFAIDGVNVFSATGVAAPSRLATNNLTLDDEYSSTDFDFGPVIIFDPGSGGCSATTAYPTDTGGKFYAASFGPTSNGSPLQFTPSAGSNWSNVLYGSGNYNYSATQGAQDLYNLTLGTLGTIDLQAEINQIENTGSGSRVTLPLADVSSSIVPGTIGFGVGNTSAETQMWSAISGTVTPSAIGVQVQY